MNSLLLCEKNHGSGPEIRRYLLILRQEVFGWQQVFLIACDRRRGHPAATQVIARGPFSAIAKHQGHWRESENSACVFLIVKKEKPVGPVGNVGESRCSLARLVQAAVGIRAFWGFPRTRHFPSGQSRLADTYRHQAGSWTSGRISAPFSPLVAAEGRARENKLPLWCSALPSSSEMRSLSSF